MSGGSWDYAHRKVFEQLAMGPLKAIEWSDSGDYAEDGWIEPVREFLERRPIDLPEVREFYDMFLADGANAAAPDGQTDIGDAQR